MPHRAREGNGTGTQVAQVTSKSLTYEGEWTPEAKRLFAAWVMGLNELALFLAEQPDMLADREDVKALKADVEAWTQEQ